MFGDLARLFGQQGPVSWDIARQIALWLATGGQPEANVDPLERIRYEELLRVAELHSAQATGLAMSTTGQVLRMTPVTRGHWALRSIDAFRPLLELLANSLEGQAEDGGPAGTDAGDADAGTDFLGSLGKVMGPVLLGMQTGFMLGHLSLRALGQYDVPVPRAPSDELLAVPANLDPFAEEWSLPVEDVRLWVCLHEVLYHAVLGQAHVRSRLLDLLEGYVSSFQIDPRGLEGALADIDPTDPTALHEALGSPATLLGAVESDAQRRLRAQIQTLTTTVAGYIDHVMDAMGRQLIGSYPRLTEALRRRRVEASDADLFVERLLGIEMGQAQYQRGAAFAAGVAERAGDAALKRLWSSPEHLPTPAELDAPGLWLARIDL